MDSGNSSTSSEFAQAIPYISFTPIAKKTEDRDTEDVERQFTVFPKLPIELRLKIWKHALPEPRLVILSHHSVRDYDDEPDSDEFNLISLKTGMRITCENVSIAMRQVNSEARAVVLDNYSPRFKDIRGGPVFFNNERDVLCLDELQGLHSTSSLWDQLDKNIARSFQQTLGLIQNVVLIDEDIMISWYGGAVEYRIGPFFDDLRNLGMVKEVGDCNCLEQEMMANLIESMAKRKKDGRQFKSDVKDPSFLRGLDKPNVFYLTRESFNDLEDGGSIWSL
ncbi:hypothetical protein BGZ57DRAFT_967065 [Hyaloscypha finlandica]|nr:hypothetical protein BGZ57DRAFT_967065 [Hyaloscypha finlandica]